MPATTDSLEQKVNQQYDRMASWYDRRWQNYIDKTLSFCQQWTRVVAAERMLDVACGTGELAKRFLQQHPNQQISGIDLSNNMLQVARQKCQAYPNVEFQRATVTKLPFANASFDLVICASAFHYFDQPQLALAEMKRVLQPNGRLIILDWCRDFLTVKILDVGLKVFDSAYRGCYTQAELHSYLTAAGLNIVEAEKRKLDLLWGVAIATAVKQAEE